MSSFLRLLLILFRELSASLIESTLEDTEKLFTIPYTKENTSVRSRINSAGIITDPKITAAGANMIATELRMKTAKAINAFLPSLVALYLVKSTSRAL